ncbi:hypothetical protein ACJ73_01952 [Blastomyces percursus]|uniref:Uncharacterized protein n=1 Tax=Blastomyces percursus TaxID=1658174 RepID=A0A1J9RGA0_9EURO|nr:hypothetical protein ACJ73_01952 [Blastomyces percursus]
MTVTHVKRKGARGRNPFETGLPKGHFKKVRQQHAKAGPTRKRQAQNTKIGKRTLLNKLIWLFCAEEFDTTPKRWCQTMDASALKAFYDWLHLTHKGRIKAHSVLHSYWRRLKSFYEYFNERAVDGATNKDSLNYINYLGIEVWKLRVLPKDKPPGDRDDIHRILYANWVRCRKTYADERQRLQVSAGILMSLFEEASEGNNNAEDNYENYGQVSEPEPWEIDSQSDAEDIPEERSRTAGTTCDRGSMVQSWLDTCADDGLSATDQRKTELAGIEMSDAQVDFDQGSVSSASIFSKAGDATDIDSECSHNDMKYDMKYPATIDDIEDDESDGDISLSDFRSATDDGYNTGQEKQRVVLWRHISFHIVHIQTPGQPNKLLSKLSILHTKGEDNKPRVKRFIITQHPEPMFDLLGQLLAMAIKDGIFAADFKSLDDIYWHKIPEHRVGMQLKIKRKKLDIPLFREPEKTSTGWRTSIPLKASTWSRILIYLGILAALAYSLTQYVFRRMVINVLNKSTQPSIRDQVADHESNALRYYIHQVVEADVQALVLGMPSDESIQAVAHSLRLEADITAPTDLTDEEKDYITRRPKIQKLAEKSRRLTTMIREAGYSSIAASYGTELYQQKMKVDSKLNRKKIRLRTKFLEYKRKKHFRNADTAEFNRQIHGGKENDGPTPSRLPELQIEERRQIVQLTCTVGIELTREDRFARQCESINLWIKLQDRKESKRIGRHKHQQPSPQADARPPSPMVIIHVNRTVPMKIYEDQCPFCASDMRLPDKERFKRWGRMNRLWDHIEKNIHREELRAYSSGRKPCGLCEQHDQYIPAGIDDFKAHTWSVHNGRFRGLDKRSFPR